MVSKKKEEALSVRTIFFEAIDKHEGKDCAAFVAEACGGDSALRKAVEELLEAHRAADPTFLDPPDVTSAGEPGEFRRHCFPSEFFERQRLQPGDIVGDYEVIEKRGEGGFALVYEAQQLRPISRRVALKVLKPGMDSAQIISRFETERQALALMHHAGIAHVYDAGATEHGHPYFVMELVDGEPITRYCDNNGLTVPARLRLFIQVCRAIQHAHQKAVIHRDIKPTNILVTVVDGEAAPVVIDFGIAKAVGGGIPGDLTSQGQFLGTPQYMSPEQAGLNNWDVDTRSDIYSLGVVLYELITGSTPLRAKDLTDAGYAAMEHMICEEQVPRPTARLASRDDETRTIAERRGAEPAKLRRMIRGDIDWIILKALEKDRTLRYETVSALADDIERHLRGEPVEASPHTVAYRFRHFVRRNKAAVAIAAALVAGIIASTWQAVVAGRAREISETARLEAEAVARYLETTLRSPAPNNSSGRSLTVAEMLDFAVKRLREVDNLNSGNRIRVFSAIGECYSGLGMHDKAVEALTEAFSIGAVDRKAPDPEMLVLMGTLAGAQRRAGNFKRAIELGEELVALERLTAGPGSERTLAAIQNLADFYSAGGRHVEAVALMKENVAGLRALRGETHAETLAALGGMSRIYRAAGRISEAIEIEEESILLIREHYGPEDPLIPLHMGHLVDLFVIAERFVEAVSLAADNVALRRKLHGDRHAQTIAALHTQAMALRAAGDIDEAVERFQDLLELRREVLGDDHPDILLSMDSLAAAYQAAHRNEDALELARECLALRRKLTGDDHYLTKTSVNTIAMIFLSGGLEEEAIELYVESLELRRQRVGTNDPNTLTSMEYLANAYRRVGRLGESIELHRETLKLRTESLGPTNPATIRSLSDLGVSLKVNGDFEEAIRCFEEALRLRETHLEQNEKGIMNVRRDLLDAYRKAGRDEEAASLERQISQR